MYFTTHLSCGLFCGALTKNSLGALCLGLVSHAALDMIPHHDYDSVGGAAVDIASGLVILSAMQTLFPGLSGPLLWGAIGGTIPDLEVALRRIFPRYKLRRLFPSHSGLLPHPQREFPKGVLVQFAIIAVCLFFCFSLGR